MLIQTTPEPIGAAFASLRQWFNEPYRPSNKSQPFQNIDWRRYQPGEIRFTEHYKEDFFNAVAENRCHLDETYLKKMIALMAVCGFLPQYPIVLDKNWMLLDGFHRYAAASRLMLREIYYVRINYTASELFPQPAPHFPHKTLILN
ncbi:MAG: hypothetical protein KF775_19770 [Cyclobacteriaceae bacterium]|nr:hypothetical protein [Cyclobacteriaceae bacterium]